MCILRAICTAHSAIYWAPFSHVHIARDMRVVYTACRLCAICKAQLALISQHLHMPPVNDKRGAYCAQYVLIMHTAHIARNGQTVHIARNVKICILSAYRAQYAPFSVPCYAVSAPPRTSQALSTQREASERKPRSCSSRVENAWRT